MTTKSYPVVMEGGGMYVLYELSPRRWIVNGNDLPWIMDIKTEAILDMVWILLSRE